MDVQMVAWRSPRLLECHAVHSSDTAISGRLTGMELHKRCLAALQA